MSPHADASFLDDNLPTLPTVLMNTHVQGDRFTSFDVDNYGGAQAMVRHLVESGRKRIAFIAGPKANHDVQERVRGYRDAMVAHGLGDSAQILDGDFTEASGYRAAKQALALSPRPDAVFAGNDMMALGCFAAFAEAGIKVPGDIAVAGFDDIPLARYITPGLTTVRVRIADLGAAALEKLAGMIESNGEVAHSRQVVSTEVVVRGSSIDGSATR
jgi:LacI family transcriptional regulator